MTLRQGLRGAALAAALVLCGAAAPHAQTTGLNPLVAIAGPESGNCTNTVNPKSSAEGCWQDLTSTWQSGLSAIGGDPQQYPTANSAPYSVQAAVNAYEYNTYGFQPWAPYDPTLAANIQAAGGPSAFAAPGTLSTNPADYTALDQPGGLQQYFADNGAGTTVGTPGMSFTMPATATQPQISVSSTPGQLSRPYSWLYNDLVTSTQQTISNEIASMELMVSSVLIPLLTLALMALALRFMIARHVSIDKFSDFLLKMAFVIPFVAAGSGWYQQYVVDPVLGLPSFFQQYTAAPTAGVTLTSPAAAFDAAYAGFLGAEEAIWNATTGVWHAFWVAIVLGIAWSIIALAISAMFAAFLVATLLSLVALVLGPVMIPCVLFESTHFLFRGWIAAGATIILSLLAIDIVLALYLGVAQQMLAALQLTGTPDTDVPSFWGAAVVMLLLGSSMYGIKPLVERIGGGVAAGLDWAAYYATGGHVRDGARTAGGWAMRFWR